MTKRSQARREHRTADEHVDRVESAVVPVVEERVTVEKRDLESGRVVVSVTPEVHRKVIDLPVMEETAVIERVAVNRVVEKAEGPRQEGEVMVVPVYEEILVVEKRLVLREEIRIGRERRTRQERREVALRSENVETRREPPKGQVE